VQGRELSTNLLYAASLDEKAPVYQPLLDVPSGITYLPFQEAEDGQQWKISRVIFLNDETMPVMGVRGIYVDKGACIAKHPEGLGHIQQQSLSHGTRSNLGPKKLIEVVTDSLGGEFGMSPLDGDAGEEEVAIASVIQPVLHWGWLLGEKLAADVRLIGVDGGWQENTFDF
jgi:hypothetical protein